MSTTLQLLTWLMFATVKSQLAPQPVCTNVAPSSPPSFTPNINYPEFSVRIEVVTQESGRVSDLRLFYSQSLNTIRVSKLETGLRSDQYFYFADNEILTFDYATGRGNCTVNTNLTGAADTFVFGGSKGNKVLEPLGVLHFTGPSGFGDEINIWYKNTATIRDMDVDVFSSCQKWQYGGQSAVVNVTHYFSRKSWSRPDPQVVPVSIEIHGSALINGQVSKIDHYYNFFDFQTSVDPLNFETPPGIVCQGRNAGQPFPNLPGYIKFGGEQLDPSSRAVSYFEEIYDSDDDFVVLRFQGIFDYGSQGGMRRYTLIRDYPTGLSYTIDTAVQSCFIQNITDTKLQPFDYINTQGKVQEITPAQLFFTLNTKYEYLGQRNIRGLMADVWVTRTNVQAFPNREVTVEWYFAQSGVSSWNDGSDYYKNGGFRMPVLLRMWLDDTTTQSLDMNIYHVDYTNIMYGTLDVRNCYPNRQSNYIQLVIDGAKELVVNTNIDQFKWNTALTLSQVAGVRYIRIADLQIYFDANDAVILFELLDVPPYASDISSLNYQPASLKDATQKLQNAVNSGNLYINVWDSATNQINKPIRVSNRGSILANNVDPADDGGGYPPGAMAGLGIAMVIIGGAGGAVGTYFLTR